ESKRMVWSTYSSSVLTDYAKVTRLIEGNEYIFRVRAENKMGTGPPTETHPIIAKTKYDRPGRPDPPDVTRVSKEEMTVVWNPPEYDGGKSITGYILEKKEKRSLRWVPVTKTPIPERRKKVTNLFPGHEYQFRVSAENEVGLGEPSLPSRPVIAKDPIEPPEIELDASMRKLVTVRAGCPIRLFAIVRGRPAPKVTWRRMGVDNVIRKGQVDLVDTMAFCVIPDSTRDDSGKYSLTLVNAAGEKAVFVNVRVLDKPGPPQPPFDISEIDADACTLSWHIPLEDGGSNITNYVVEKCDVSRGDWVTALSSVTKTSCRIGKLIPGEEYMFRVRAENRFGISEPLASGKMIARYPFDVPSEPKNARITKVNKDCIFVAWDKPDSDGGSPITGYLIERKERNSLLWVKANDTAVRSTEYPCVGLIEGLEYTFRIYALNRAGASKPSKPTEFVTARAPVDPPGKPEVIDVTKSTASLVWTRPKHDGGSKLIGYFVEACKLPGDKWERCNTTPYQIPLEEYTVTGLEENAQYQFRAIAKTAVNISRPSEPSDPVTIHPENVPPRIELDLSMQSQLTVKAGTNVRLEANVYGKPMPAITWKKEGEVLKPSEGVKITTQRNLATVELFSVNRKQTGDYTITAENASGSKSATIRLKVLDKPGPPASVKIKHMYADRAMLSWEPPLEDGGSEITNYIVDKRETSRPNWAQVSANVPITSCTVERLIEGHEYQFRICAENKYGVGDPILTEPAVAKNPYDPPGPPAFPKVVDTTRNSISLSWSKPAYDGGSPIIGYLVESKRADTDNWVRCNLPKNLQATQFVVTGL
ncbi:TITIN protein, partial [Cercotrichas coryphoeus]|nr:TITIN protein [Cercotrichas coryphoeus]